MTILITGSSGHLGEAIARTLDKAGRSYIGIDIKEGPYTHHCGSISDRQFVAAHMKGVEAVLHTATLHKPHVETHSRQDFIDTNISGTQTLLDAAITEKVGAFVFTSTTSVFGNAMKPKPGEGAVWVTEDIVPIPKNIYGITKLAAENLCALAYQKNDLPCIVLRTSRFFPEDDDQKHVRDAYENDNAKLNEFLYRRGDPEDMVSAHLQAIEKAPDIGFDRFIISATPPFQREDAEALGKDASQVIARYFDYDHVYEERGWKMLPVLDRIYDNSKARNALAWEPSYNFQEMLMRVAGGERPASELALQIGKKGYHDREFEEGPYPVE